MKKIILHFSYILIGLLMVSCSSTKETSSTTQQPYTQAQIAQWQEQQRANEEARQSGLDQEVVRVLKGYAEKKANLACKLKRLDEASSQALSEVEQADFKQQIITLDQELNTLSQEIDNYCKNDQERADFFNQIYRQYSNNCN